MKLFRFIRQQPVEVAPNREGQDVLDELERVRAELITAQKQFEYEAEQEMIEARIYEIKALEARYHYLLRIARELGISNKCHIGLKKTV